MSTSDGSKQVPAPGFERAYRWPQRKASASEVTWVLDPYWLWADLTGYRYLNNDQEERIRLVAAWRRGGESNSTRLESMNDDTQSRKLEEVSAPADGYLFAKTRKGKIEDLGALLEVADFVLAEPGMRPLAETGLWPVSIVGSMQESAAAMTDAKEKQCVEKVVIGVIDGRCGFANKRLRETETTSRIDFFWDQTDTTSTRSRPSQSWKRPEGFRYGRELDREALDELAEALAAGPSPALRTPGEVEKAMYRTLDYDFPEDADWSHGTHVLDTILTDFQASDRELTDFQASDRKPAARPGVIYVQLPDKALRDTSARWAAFHVLDALRYILARACKEAHVVVNLSLGSFAGPHDGSSLIERAIDDLVEKERRLTVVVAAGNTGRVVDDGTGEPAPCHVRATLACKGEPRSVQLKWIIDVADTTESFMEIWLPEPADGANRSSVSVSLRPATTVDDKSQTILAEPGEFKSLPDTSVEGRAIAAVINATGPYKAPNGRGGMVLVALGHTRDTNRPCAPVGCWIITVTNMSLVPVTFDAWVERRDVPGGLAGFRPQYAFDRRTEGLTPTGSLGSLANGGQTIVVGAAEYDAKSNEYKPSDFSSVGAAAVSRTPAASTGPNRVPDVFCSGEIKAAGFLTGSEKTLAGTSMAAAQVTAALAWGVATRKIRPFADRVMMLESLRSQAGERHRLHQARVAVAKGGWVSDPPMIEGHSGFVLPTLAVRSQGLEFLADVQQSPPA